ncbi:hypothetical protein KM043_003263 [Ampulex compressa]|nr:hypothetical protein KM043_003263 [Ampulex compressa]
MRASGGVPPEESAARGQGLPAMEERGGEQEQEVASSRLLRALRDARQRRRGPPRLGRPDRYSAAHGTLLGAPTGRHSRRARLARRFLGRRKLAGGKGRCARVGARPRAEGRGSARKELPTFAGLREGSTLWRAFGPLRRVSRALEGGRVGGSGHAPRAASGAGGLEGREGARGGASECWPWSTRTALSRPCARTQPRTYLPRTREHTRAPARPRTDDGVARWHGVPSSTRFNRERFGSPSSRQQRRQAAAVDNIAAVPRSRESSDSLVQARVLRKRE